MDVLVVDDDPDILEVLSVVLTGAGYSVSTASNGSMALDRLRENELPKLILLDLMMPVMNAWDFRREQAQEPALAKVPVMLMTGFHQATDDVALLGAVDLIPKPIELDTLLANIKRIVTC